MPSPGRANSEPWACFQSRSSYRHCLTSSLGCFVRPNTYLGHRSCFGWDIALEWESMLSAYGLRAVGGVELNKPGAVQASCRPYLLLGADIFSSYDSWHGSSN